MYFLKIHRFHASFFEFCMVLRASASLLCPLFGNFFKNLRTIVGRYSLELLHLIEAGVQRNRDLIVFSDTNLLDELLQNGAAFIVVGGVVNIRPCKQLVADLFTDTTKLEKEKQLQEVMLGLKKKFGKNAVLKGTNYLDGATMRERNKTIGGHKNKPTVGRTKAIHRRLELSFNLYLLLLFVGQDRASKSLLHITPRIFRFLQFFNK